ncbi:MAG: hypothetical protein KJ674_02930 [Nanoarchaeota archaeon]|nr:hypothetical protein [Nanoarchaeota archaeon]
MKESTLLKLALITSLLGILIILFISEKTEIPSSDIKSINKNLLNKEVQITALVENVIETPGLYILTVKDNSASIKVIVFKEDPINITENSIIEIIGTVTEYKNQTEIIAKEIII